MQHSPDRTLNRRMKRSFASFVAVASDGTERSPDCPDPRVRRLCAGWRLVAAMCCIAAGPVHSASDPATVAVYRAAGTTQCANTSVDLEALSAPLKAAGIAVRASRCASDGLMRKMLCGSPDGRLAVFDIPKKDGAAASKLGFSPLSALPDAQEVPCR